MGMDLLDFQFRVERSFGRFSRSLELPKGVDPQSVSAHFDKGVLEVRMPKPEERKPTRIEVRSALVKSALRDTPSPYCDTYAKCC